MFGWMKRTLPRGLFGRAALILLLPVISLQLVVSAVFIQRHYDWVTAQMTQAVALDLSYVLQQVSVSATPQATAQALAPRFDVSPAWPEASSPARKRLLDVSGRVVARELHAALPALRRVDLCGTGEDCPTRVVSALFDTPHGLLDLRFARARVSAANPHQLLVIMGGFGAIMTTIAFLYLRNQVRPISRLAAAAQAYGRGQVVPYKISGATEVRAAGAAFLDMRGKLERQTRARNLMLSGVSHDLRTPLTRMRLALSLMDPQEAAPLSTDVDEMEYLVNAFLDYARDEADDETQMIAPAEILHDAVQSAARLGHEVQVAPGPDLPPVPLRGMAMRRALENLIVNGIKYGGQVRVGLESGPKTLRFVVEDDGPGIPEAQRAAAMQPFARLDPARNQDAGSGVGLGLAIVADVARGHGGRLELSESPLGGLCAAIVLPC